MKGENYMDQEKIGRFIQETHAEKRKKSPEKKEREKTHSKWFSREIKYNG